MDAVQDFVSELEGKTYDRRNAASTMPAVMSALGAEWKQLGDAEKAKFQALAAQPVQ